MRGIFLHGRPCLALAKMIVHEMLTRHLFAVANLLDMHSPLIGGDIKRCFCLTSVCLLRTSGLSREQRGV